MAKRFATDACYKVADDALQLLGGYGYLQARRAVFLVSRFRCMLCELYVQSHFVELYCIWLRTSAALIVVALRHSRRAPHVKDIELARPPFPPFCRTTPLSGTCVT